MGKNGRRKRNKYSNRKRGFRYEREAARLLLEMLEKYKRNMHIPEQGWWSVRIPLSAGAIVIRNGYRDNIPGDVLVGCDGYGVAGIEVKSRKRIKDLDRAIPEVKTRFLVARVDGNWLFFYKGNLRNSCRCNGRLDNQWIPVKEDEFIRLLTQDVLNNGNSHRHNTIIIPYANNGHDYENTGKQQLGDRETEWHR